MPKKIAVLIIISFMFFGITNTASAQYHVKPGDTMYKIAKAHNMTLKDLVSLNLHIPNPNNIKINDYIVIRSKTEPQKDLTDYARSLQYITVYRYGGQNFPTETDCSGWAQGVFKKFGVNLPRTSREQALTGKPVEFKDLQIGDLMFFSTNADKTITHTGIYLGNNYWISNLNERKNVEIMSSWNSWTQKYFLWGARHAL
jgi:cell wall-associated NlpC family hydrolase